MNMLSRLQRKENRSQTFRRRRFALFLTLVDRVLSSKKICRIIDIGGEPQYWNTVADLIGERLIHVTLLNKTVFKADNTMFESISGDARDLSSLNDMSFDLVHSNSVIEHVGNWLDMCAMAREVRRLAPSYLVQTPNFWFPMEQHCSTLFFHWMPEPVRVSLLMRRPRSYWGQAPDVHTAMGQIQSVMLLDSRGFAALFDDAKIYRERFFGLTKSLIAIRDGSYTFNNPS
jgi:Methyltransferase domain